LGIQELTDSSIRFRLVICASYIEQFEIDRELKKEIVIVLKQNDITIPYKQVVIHDGKRI
jgi:small-conductance mechanosensitive channel